jgi:hypothetical protein
MISIDMNLYQATMIVGSRITKGNQNEMLKLRTAWANLAQTLSLKNKRREAIGAYLASYMVSKNQEKVFEVYKRIVDDPLEREDPQLRKDLKVVLDIIQSSSNLN